MKNCTVYVSLIFLGRQATTYVLQLHHCACVWQLSEWGGMTEGTLLISWKDLYYSEFVREKERKKLYFKLEEAPVGMCFKKKAWVRL